MTSRRGRRLLRGAAAALVSAFGLAGAVACGGGVPPPDGEVLASFLAVGDTGTRNAAPVALFDGAMRVGRSMQHEHRSRPVDGLVLLGDMFYPNGLNEEELVDRVATNLVEPFCRFLDLSAARSSEVASWCPLRASERHPVPVWAILGNHDVVYESPRLQREAIPAFVRNWRMAAGTAGTADLGAGVSLILVDYTRLLREEDLGALADAIRRSRGPWRILAIHAPIATLPSRSSTAVPGESHYARLIRAAIEDAGQQIQLVLSGHEHSLQVLEMSPSYPPLHVVAGGGSNALPVDTFAPGRRFALESTGFARIDMSRLGGRERLVVSLVEVPGGLRGLLAARRLAARWSVDETGRVHDELAGSQ